MKHLSFISLRTARFILLFAAMFLVCGASADTAWAVDYRVVQGRGKDICTFVIERMHKFEDRVFVGPEAFIDKWNWERGSFYWTSSTMNGELPTLFTHYDIDNDGTREIILRMSAMLRSHENIVLYVFEAGTIDFTKKPQLTPEILEKTPKIRSGPGAWSYGKHGLYLLLTSPLTYKGVNYVVLMDELFGRKGFGGRNLVVAKYLGVPIDLGSNRTDKLQIVCKIEPIGSF